MKPLTAPEIRGTWGTLLLPINDDESINYSKLSEEIDCLIADGVDGIYSNGTVGEFYAQSEGEFDRVNQLLAEKCERAGMPFQIGASFMNAQISLERARRAAQFKPSAIQIILPDWSPVTLEEAIAFLQRIAEAVAPVTLVLYNPPHAKRVLQPRELAALCEAVPSLAGVKVAGGDTDWYAAMRPLLSRLSVFVPGHLLASGVAQGAHGAYSNIACLQPRGAKRWNELMATDLVAALEIEGRIQKFMTDYILPFREKYGASTDIAYNQHAWVPLVPKGSRRIYMFSTEPAPGDFNGHENSGIGFRYSDDDGWNWSKVTRIRPANDPDFHGMWCINMTETDKGTWLLAPHAADWDKKPLHTQLYILCSADKGKTWELLPGKRPNGWQWKPANRMDEGRPLALGNGKVVLFARTQEGHIWQLRSEDDGKTWSEPRFLAVTSTTLTRPLFGTEQYVLTYSDTLADKGQLHIFIPHLWRQVLHVRMSEKDLLKLPTRRDLFPGQ